MMKFAPKAQLTANTDNWGPYYTQRIQDVIDGSGSPKTPGTASARTWS